MNWRWIASGIGLFVCAIFAIVMTNAQTYSYEDRIFCSMLLASFGYPVSEPQYAVERSRRSALVVVTEKLGRWCRVSENQKCGQSAALFVFREPSRRAGGETPGRHRQECRRRKIRSRDRFVPLVRTVNGGISIADVCATIRLRLRDVFSGGGYGELHKLAGLPFHRSAFPNVKQCSYSPRAGYGPSAGMLRPSAISIVCAYHARGELVSFWPEPTSRCAND